MNSVEDHMPGGSVSGVPRLVHAAEYPLPRAGSFIPMVLASLMHARDLGWEVEAVFPEAARDREWIGLFREQSIPVRFGEAGSRRQRTAWLRAQLSGHDGPTVLHTHFSAWDLPAVAAAPRIGRTAVVWHIHSTLSRSRLIRARNLLRFGLAGRRVAAILCPAPNIADDVKARLGPADRVHFVPSAIDLASFPLVGPDERSQARRELGLAEDAVVLLHFGWHWYLKGGDAFVDVVGLLRDDGTDGLVGLERGGGSEAEKDIADHGLEDVIRRLEPVDDIRPLYAAADVLVSSSRSEGLAYTVLESISSGTPVVATNIPGHAYIAEHVAACRLVRRDPGELAEAVRALLAQKGSQRDAEIEQARAWFAENLSFAANAERLQTYYDEAVVSL